MTAWDRRVVLYSKRKLKDFRLGHLFLREDLSPEHKDRRQKVGPASGNQSSSAGSKSASVHRGSSGSPLRTLSPVVPTSEKFVCREGTGPFLFTHLCSYTTVSLLTASSDNTSPTDASALCAAAPSVPLQDKTIVNSSRPSRQLTPSYFSSSTSGGQIREGSTFNHGN